MRGGGPDDQEDREEVPHQEPQGVDESLGGGGGGEDTHGVVPGPRQAEGGADSQLGTGGQERQEQQAKEEVAGHLLHLGRNQQADYQVVGQALTGIISFNIHSP